MQLSKDEFVRRFLTPCAAQKIHENSTLRITLTNRGREERLEHAEIYEGANTIPLELFKEFPKWRKVEPLTADRKGKGNLFWFLTPCTAAGLDAYRITDRDS